MGTSIINILSEPLSLRKDLYGTTDIQRLIIDGQIFSGYKTFSSHWEKTYVEQPERSASGVIDNLDDYATFTTFIVKVNFAMMSIEDYRELYRLMLTKNEFLVTAYNVLDGQAITQKMYFAPDQMPKLYAMARKLQGEKFIEVLGVQDYTIELIGTNVDVELITIKYYGTEGISSNPIKSITVEPNSWYVVGKDIVVNNNENYQIRWKREGIDNRFTYGTELQATLITGKEISSKNINYIAEIY